MNALPPILIMASNVEAEDLCARNVFFFGQQFKRKPPEEHNTEYETGLLFSIDLWNWTKNSTDSQGTVHIKMSLLE